MSVHFLTPQWSYEMEVVLVVQVSYIQTLTCPSINTLMLKMDLGGLRARSSAVGQSQQMINQTTLVRKDALKGPEAGEYF